MVAPKSGSAKIFVAAVVTSVVLGFVLACASTMSDSGNFPAASSLTDVLVDSESESSAVTLVGLLDPIYTASYDADLQAVVIELASVDAADVADRVEIYDGIIDYVTTSTFAEEGGEPITRVEIALGTEASYAIEATEYGLRIGLVPGPVGPASADEDGSDWASGEAAAENDGWVEGADADPWADAEGDDLVSALASDEAVADAQVELAPPPVATSLTAVQVESLGSGVLVHLTANGSIWAVESFVLDNPDRLVVDLPGLSLETAIAAISVDHAMVERVRIGAHTGKVRIVIDGGDLSVGFPDRSIKPSADGLYLAVGSGEDIELALTAGLDAAQASWNEAALAQMEASESIAAATAGESDAWSADDDEEWGEEGYVAYEDEASVLDEDTDETELADAAPLDDDWASVEEAAIDDEWASAEEAVSEDEWVSTEVTPIDPADSEASVPDASWVAVHGVHYTPMENLDRIAILSEAIVDYEVYSPNPDTLVVSLLGATIAPEVAGRIRGKSGGPVSLITIFEQPDVEGGEVRLVVTRASGQEPLISRRGSLLFIDFEHLGVAAAPPPAFPEQESIGLAAATIDDTGVPANSEESAWDDAAEWDEAAESADAPLPVAAAEGSGEELVAQAVSFDDLPEFAENPGVDGPAGMDQDFAGDDLDSIAQDDEFASLTPPADNFGDFDDFDDLDGPDFEESGAASLEPPAAVELLQEGGLVDGKKYVGRRISLDFNDVPISDVLRLIAEVSDLNLIAGDEVKGNVTIRLVDVPWDQALDVVLLTKGLGFVRVGNILRVAPADIIAAEEELRLQERRNKEKLEDLMVKLLPVNYASVKDMQKLAKRLLSSRGTVNIDERTNTLILKDIASVIDETVALVKALDTETPQVMIEAKIVEANLNFSRELGSTWGIATQPFVDPFSGSVVRDDLGTSSFRFHGSNGVAFSNPITSTPTALADLGAFLLDEKLDLNIQLRAAESMGEGKVISSPRIVTLDNGEATIRQGVSIPFQTFEGGDAKLEFIDAVLSLKVTPHITADRSIIMDIEITRNAPDDSVPTPTGSPAIAKAEATTTALVKDGQTLVIGGIYTINKSERESRVPYLYRLPIIGAAFRSKELTDIRKELLIFVTPRIITSPSLSTRG